MLSKDLKDKLIIVGFAGLILLAVFRYDDLSGTLNVLLASMNALLVGAILAFILNVPMKHLENMIGKISVFKRIKRPLALTGVLLVLVLIIFSVSAIVIPIIISTIQDIISTVRHETPRWVDYWREKGVLSYNNANKIEHFVKRSIDLKRLSEMAPSILFGVFNNIKGFFAGSFSLVVSFFLTLSMLATKEQLQSMSERVLRAIFSKKVVDRAAYAGKVLVDTYDQFLSRQIIEAVIMGTLIFVIYSVCQLPYASLAAILFGLLSFIPFIGPLTACIICALLILAQNPWQSLLSIVIFMLLQIIEGHVIYPRVVGKSVGLPTLFTLSALLIGGGLFGFLGMLFFVPLFAVFYRLGGEWVSHRLIQKEIAPEEMITKV